MSLLALSTNWGPSFSETGYNQSTNLNSLGEDVMSFTSKLLAIFAASGVGIGRVQRDANRCNVKDSLKPMSKQSQSYNGQ